MSIFSKDVVNRGRQTEVDLLRGFTSIILVIVHVGYFLGNNISKGLWTFCDIIGSEFSAPVLMALMGISLSYSRHKEPKDLLKRGISLFFKGYALNILRSLLPLAVFGNIDEWASVDAFFVVDILQFAGLAFMLFALLKKLKLSSLFIFAISIVMVIIDQFIMLPDNISWNSRVITAIVNLFCPLTMWSCFPLLTWFCFPAFGLVLGEALTHCNNKKKLYSILLPIGLAVVLYVYYNFHLLYPDYTKYYWGDNFYYMGLKNVFLTFFFICFALAFWFFVGNILSNSVKKFLGFMSRNLNIYYLFSWIIISALIHLQAIYNWQFDNFKTLSIMLLVIVSCLGLILCIHRKSEFTS